ncbi:MAG: hypothetical protein JGK23_27185 [Microcoleus sp. PH2017_19_SFW_U_A]|uniref:hypothetical protein n=1 Tax=Microcoleus sp. PH2017_32_RDM_D_A TaxID=2798842 RepID=UPI001D989C55|nr:hypothetical protein [Microcoleus sp. PH2017_32_RDM_D_A]MCC3506358.1 hypothetical protein [Microcoleus sp. PH2017_19_SFW_U_A]MCC3553861.1 hypothetical protein [Microcoleus sp. PH2017_35_SFW_U_B]
MRSPRIGTCDTFGRCLRRASPSHSCKKGDRILLMYPEGRSPFFSQKSDRSLTKYGM